MFFHSTDVAFDVERSDEPISHLEKFSGLKESSSPPLPPPSSYSIMN
jgi:hypothetical protein